MIRHLNIKRVEDSLDSRFKYKKKTKFTTLVQFLELTIFERIN